jgi:chromate reductase, NAD(P)H dehydrogenase (quinone)
VGSLATASIDRKFARALIRLAPEGLEFDGISFRDLPLYSYDYDDDFPAAARAFKTAIVASDAVLFVMFWFSCDSRLPRGRDRGSAGSGLRMA